MNKVKGYLESKGEASYGVIGTETSIKDVNGNKLHVGDLVDLYKGEEFRRSNKSIVSSDPYGFYVMGIAGCCEHDGQIIDNWRVKLLKKYYDVEDGFESDGDVIHHVEKQEDPLQTEFTYQEVIARIKDGEYYRCTRGDFYKVKDIKMSEGHIILLGNIHDGVGISIKQLFVQEEYKQEYEIYYITFPDSEEQFQFRYDPSADDDYMSLGEIVICNLDNDKKAYGKVSDLKEVSMTEKEYLELNLIESIN